MSKHSISQAIAVRQMVLDALAKVGDEGMTITSLANVLSLGQACLRPVLSDLGGTMAIRCTQGFRNVRYWIPTEEQLRIEEEARNIRPFRPLKIDKHRQERYAEIEAYRIDMPSIG